MSEPRKLRVIEDNGDRGGIIEIPLAVPSLITNPEMTAGKGSTQYKIDDQVFSQIIGNFSKWSGPVPVYFGHIKSKDRRTQPAAGFVRKVWQEQGDLWGRIDLGPSAFSSVVRERGFSSFSVELVNSPALPTGDLAGWTLTGGALTNTPALDVQYVAAENADPLTQPVRLTVPLVVEGQKEHSMSGTLDGLQAEKAALEQKEKDLAVKLAKAEADNKALAEKVAALEKSGDQVAGLKASLDALKSENEKTQKQLSDRAATDAIKLAINDGKLLPAQVQDWEKDPTAAITKLGFSGVEAFSKFVASAPAVIKLGGMPVSSGKGGAQSDSPKAQMEAEVMKRANEKGITFAAAFEQIRVEKPELFLAATKKED